MPAPTHTGVQARSDDDNRFDASAGVRFVCDSASRPSPACSFASRQSRASRSRHPRTSRRVGCRATKGDTHSVAQPGAPLYHFAHQGLPCLAHCRRSRPKPSTRLASSTIEPVPF